MGGRYMLGEECGCECVNVGRGVHIERVYCMSMSESMHLKEGESVDVVGVCVCLCVCMDVCERVCMCRGRTAENAVSLQILEQDPTKFPEGD